MCVTEKHITFASFPKHKGFSPLMFGDMFIECNLTLRNVPVCVCVVRVSSLIHVFYINLFTVIYYIYTQYVLVFYKGLFAVIYYIYIQYVIVYYKIYLYFFCICKF